jgi:signal transduction histidine kinase
LHIEDIGINAIKEDIVILVSNLLDNAFKYSDRKEINIELTKNKLVVSNKVGYIKEDVKDKLLEPFIKGNTNKHKNSTGLGLYICKKTCENNGFELTYEMKEDIILFKVDFN